MSKKKTGKFSANKKKSRKGLVFLLAAAALVLAALLAMLLLNIHRQDAAPEPAESQNAPETEATVMAQTVPSETVAHTDIIYSDADYGLRITDMGGYTGMYMEDGTDDILSGIMMLVVENFGDRDVQYAEITMDLGEQRAQFTLTTLPVGESVVLLEKNRMAWDDSRDYSDVTVMIENVAYFQTPLSIMADKLQIGILNGAINVTNISGEDITGIISVYYKNAAADIYYGGITYRVQIKEGLKAGEVHQIMTQHASETGSKIMFVTVSQ